MKPVVNYLRNKGMYLILYLDDFLFINSSKDLCKKNMKEAETLLESLRFIINCEKSCLIASQKCKYLGFIIDSIKFSLNLTDEKQRLIAEVINKFKVGNNYKIRDFATLLGVLTSACPAVTYGFIHCKRLERQKFLSLKFNGGDYEGKIFISKSMGEDLNWWKKNTLIGSQSIRTQNFAVEIFSDSSLTGCGCFSNGRSASGF